MKSKLVTSLSIATLLVVGPVLAQTQAQDTPRQTHSAPTELKGSTGAQAEISGRDLKVSEKELHNAITDANKASKIIGMEVRNTQNERVGKIKDLAVDVRSGRVAYAVLSAGGSFFGMNKNVAIPLEALAPQPGENHFVIDADKNQLASAAGFADDAWPAIDEVDGQTAGLSAATVETEEEREAKEERTKRSQSRDAQRDSLKSDPQPKR